MQVISGAGRFTRPAGPDGTHWIEHLSVADLSAGNGTRSQPARTYGQEPHTEDEIYVVTAGRAVPQAGGYSVPVGPGLVAGPQPRAREQVHRHHRGPGRVRAVRARGKRLEGVAASPLDLGPGEPVRPRRT